MEKPELSQANMMSRSGAVMAQLRLSQAGKPAARCAPGDSPACKHQPCREAGKEIKGAGRGNGAWLSFASRVREDPAQVPAPHLGLQGMPHLLPSHPDSPWCPRDGKMKSERSKVFF